jgi:hypothetical protein
MCGYHRGAVSVWLEASRDHIFAAAGIAQDVSGQ